MKWTTNLINFIARDEVTVLHMGCHKQIHNNHNNNGCSNNKNKLDEKVSDFYAIWIAWHINGLRVCACVCKYSSLIGYSRHRRRVLRLHFTHIWPSYPKPVCLGDGGGGVFTILRSVQRICLSIFLFLSSCCCCCCCFCCCVTQHTDTQARNDTIFKCKSVQIHFLGSVCVVSERLRWLRSSNARWRIAEGTAPSTGCEHESNANWKFIGSRVVAVCVRHTWHIWFGIDALHAAMKHSSSENSATRSLDACPMSSRSHAVTQRHHIANKARECNTPHDNRQKRLFNWIRKE